MDALTAGSLCMSPDSIKFEEVGDDKVLIETCSDNCVQFRAHCVCSLLFDDKAMVETAKSQQFLPQISRAAKNCCFGIRLHNLSCLNT
jgi:hypothetical protein